MMYKTVNCIAFAAGCMLAVTATAPANAQALRSSAAASPVEVITNGPQASPGDNGDWSAHRNVVESRNYERLLAANPAFRHQRMRLECGPITDPLLHHRCLATFRE